MFKKLVLFLFLLSSTQAWAAPTFIQIARNNVNGETPGVFTISDVQQGSAIIVAIRLTDVGNTTVTTPGLSWTKDLHKTNGTGQTLDIWSVPNVNAGNYTISISIDGGSAIRAVALEYSGLATSSMAHVSSSAQGYSTSPNSGSITTSIDGCLLFAAATTDSDKLGWSAGSGYTLRNNPNGGSEPDQKLGVEDRGPVNAGTYSGNFTITLDVWLAAVVAYKPSGTSESSPIHWVSTTGSAAWAACSGATDPSVYCSLSTANSNIVAGETVYLKAGTYTSSYIAPSNSGTEDNKITYKKNGTDIVTISSQAYGVYLNGDDYIVVDGILVDSCTHPLWLSSAANYNIIQNCSFDDNNAADWNHSIIYQNSSYNWINNCQFSKGGANTGGDDIGSVLDVGNESSAADHSWYNLIENCTFFHGGHHVVALMTGNNTFRNNYLHNEAWSNGYGNRTLYTNSGSATSVGNVIEGNRFGYAYTSIDDGAVGNAVITSPYNIFRYNKIYHSNAYGLGLAGYSGYSNAATNRIYNNTLFNNGLVVSGGEQDSAVWVTNAAGLTPSGNVFKNNLYYSHYQVYSGSSYSSQTYANEYNGDVSGNPLFVSASTTPPSDKTDETLPDLGLQSGSPAINYGGALTTVAVADTGTGTSLVVSDARYFQDGTKAPSGLVEADWIAVGTVSNTVQISSIDYSTNTITLASTITRSDLQSVWLYKKSDGSLVLYSTAPDCGAEEYGSGEADTEPPIMDNLSPSGILACTNNPLDTTLSLSTNETAECRMSETNIPFSSMTDTFLNTNSTSHSEVKSISCGESKTYYIRCNDISNNTNEESATISFSIASPMIAGPGGLRLTGGKLHH